MNEKLIDEAGNMAGQLTNFIEKINQGANFTIEQAPEVIQQFILWERMICCFSLFFILLGGIIIKVGIIY